MPVAPRPSDDAASSVFTPHQQRILAVLLIPIFMSLLAVSSINVALPALQRGLDASDAELQWAISGYTLVFGMVLVPAGRAGDLFGRRRLFMVGLGVFALGALLSGLAPTGVLLVLARLGRVSKGVLARSLLRVGRRRRGRRSRACRSGWPVRAIA